jgi:hypothetical protein
MESYPLIAALIVTVASVLAGLAVHRGSRWMRVALLGSLGALGVMTWIAFLAQFSGDERPAVPPEYWWVMAAYFVSAASCIGLAVLTLLHHRRWRNRPGAAREPLGPAPYD